MENKNYFFVDAETDGLYGSFISIAVIVKNNKNQTTDMFYGAVKPENLKIHSAWVEENVIPHIKNAHTFFESEYDMLEAFWAFWIKHKDTAYAAGDVISPVEARLLAECVKHDEVEREFLGPYPFLDLASVLIAKGVDPLTSRTELADNSLIQHDPLNDVELLSEIWFRYINNNEVD